MHAVDIAVQWLSTGLRKWRGSSSDNLVLRHEEESPMAKKRSKKKAGKKKGSKKKGRKKAG